MMKRTIIFPLTVLLLLLFTHAKADAYLDSLMNELKTGESTPALLNELAMAWYPINLDSGSFFAQKALDFAMATSDDAQIAEAYYQIGDGYYYRNQVDSAILFFQKSLGYYLKTDLNNDIAGVANDIGQIYQMVNELDSSLFYFDLALNYIDIQTLPEGYYSIRINIANAYYFKGEVALANEQLFKVLEEGKDHLPIEKMAVVYNNIGLNYKRVANYAKSVEYYKKSMHIDDSLKLHKDLITDFTNIGNTFYQWKKFDQAILYFEKALQLAEQEEDLRQKAKVFSDMAGAYRGKEEFEKSLDYYQKARAIATEINDGFTLGIVDYGTGMTHYQAGAYQKALPFLIKGEQTFRKYKNNYALASVLLVKGRVQLALNHAYEAKQSLFSADTLAQAIHAIELRKDIALSLANVFSSLSDHKSSTQWYKRFVELNDSVFKKRGHEILTEYEVKLGVLQQQREVEQVNLKSELQAQRLSFQSKIMWLLGGGALVFLILSLIAWRLYVAKARSYALLFERNQAQLQEDKQRNQQRKNNMSEDLGEQLLQRILHKLDDEKWYLSEDISAHKLAELLETNTSYLSQVINEHFDTNFNGMINKYRVDRAQEMLLDKEYEKYTIEAIGRECGFKSKSSFNQAFKKYTGLTPSYYKQQGN